MSTFDNSIFQLTSPQTYPLVRAVDNGGVYGNMLNDQVVAAAFTALTSMPQIPSDEGFYEWLENNNTEIRFNARANGYRALLMWQLTVERTAGSGNLFVFARVADVSVTTTGASWRRDARILYLGDARPKRSMTLATIIQQDPDDGSTLDAQFALQVAGLGAAGQTVAVQTNYSLVLLEAYR